MTDQKSRPRTQLAISRSFHQAGLDILTEARRALEEPRANAVRIHDFRKAMKRFRALLRLLELTLGEEARIIRLQARDLSRELGRSRDSQSAIDAVRDLAKIQSKASLAESSFKTIIDRLTALKKASEQDLLSTDVRFRLIAWLDATDVRVRMWPPDAPTFPELAAGLTTYYRRARRRLPDKWSAATPDEVHEFRQRVIAYRYQLDLIESLRPRLVRKWIGAAQRIRARLGRHQDLVLLCRLSEPGQPLARWRGKLAVLIKERQADHLAAAARNAARVFEASPKVFRKKIEALWAERGKR